MSSFSKRLAKISQKTQILTQKIESLQLPSDTEKLKRNLQQLHDDSISTAKFSQYDEKIKNKAQVIMAHKGYDLDRLLDSLDAIRIKPTFERDEENKDTDLESYLQKKQDILLMSVIEESKRETMQNFTWSYESYIGAEWETTKRELVDFFVKREDIWSKEYSKNPDWKYDLETDYYSSSANKGKISSYLQVVKDFNNAKQRGEVYDFAGSCLRALLKLDAKQQVEKEVKINWEILKTLLSPSTPSLPSKNSSIDAQLSVGAVTNSTPVSHSITRQRIMLKRAQEFLENQYFSYIRKMVSQNLQKTTMNPDPTTCSWVLAYLKLLFPKPHPNYEKLSNSNLPLWGVIYCCLRCGDVDAALEVAQENPASQSTVPFIKAFEQNKGRNFLPEDIKSQVFLEYRKTRSSQDPFKQIVLNLLGRCEPQRLHTEIEGWKTEDFLWLRLNMVSLVEETNMKSPLPITPGTPSVQGVANSIPNSSFNQTPNHYNASSSNIYKGGLSFSMNDSFIIPSTPSSPMISSNSVPLTLTQFQASLRQLGINHFKNPILYFQVLLLSLQFEHALAYLETTQYQVDNLHYALTLYNENALVLPPNPLNAHTSGYSESVGHFFNVIRRIRSYVGNFVLNDVKDAFNYLFLIQDTPIRHRSVKELVLETGAFDILLGVSQEDGSHIPGYIEKYITHKQWLEIVESSALNSEENGNYDISIQLYYLAGNGSKAIELITKQLSSVLTQSTPERSKLIAIAEFLNKKYPSPPQGPGSLELQRIHRSFTALLGLAKFFDYYRAANYPLALKTITQLSIIPFDNNDLDSKIMPFKFYKDCIKKNMAEVLLATMSCIHKIFIGIKEEGLNSNREKFLVSLKKKASAVSNFIGLIKLQMGGDKLTQMVRMNAEMV